MGFRHDPPRWSLDDFEFVWSTVKTSYPYLELKGIDWEGVRQEYLAGIDQGAGEDLQKLIVDLLGELRDGHVYLEVDGSRDYPYHPSSREERRAFEPKNLGAYLGGSLRKAANGTFYYQKTSGNLGYVYFPCICHSRLGGDFAEAMATFEDTDGLILDLRNNGGGRGDLTAEVVEWFLTSPLEKPPVYRRGRRRIFPPFQPKARPYQRPVVVMVNGGSFSEAERLVEIMKQIPSVTVVGETTGGGSAGGGDRFVLPNGSTLSFGTYDFRRYDGTPWETVGITPDVRVPQTPVHAAAGRDPQLEWALNFLR